MIEKFIEYLSVCATFAVVLLVIYVAVSRIDSNGDMTLSNYRVLGVAVAAAVITAFLGVLHYAS